MRRDRHPDQYFTAEILPEGVNWEAHPCKRRGFNQPRLSGLPTDHVVGQCFEVKARVGCHYFACMFPTAIAYVLRGRIFNNRAAKNPQCLVILILDMHLAALPWTHYNSIFVGLFITNCPIPRTQGIQSEQLVNRVYVLNPCVLKRGEPRPQKLNHTTLASDPDGHYGWTVPGSCYSVPLLPYRFAFFRQWHKSSIPYIQLLRDGYCLIDH
jgi:hypothetical protein